ncbi:MAG: TonB-dependent receptor [Caulobacteraceae bacterium]|nr:TonB-dependent receptor [Caulobacteraceae bacterium]
MSRIGKLITTTAVALVGAIATHAAAETASAAATPATAAAPGVTLENVVVTARRRAERLQDVPISVVANSGEQLKQRGVYNLDSLRKVVPGYRAEVQGPGRMSSINIEMRGQRMYGNLPSQDVPTAVYFDEMAMVPDDGLNAAFYDLDNVQALRGPQGTLFGRNTTGGAVLIQPKTPIHSFDLAFTAGYGNYNTNHEEGYINIPVNDQLALRLAGYHRSNDGWEHSITPGWTSLRGGGDDATSIRASVDWRPTDNFDNVLLGYFTRDHNETLVPHIIAMNPNSAAEALFGATINNEIYTGGDFTAVHLSRYQPFEHIEDWAVVDTATAHFNWLTVKNIITYRHLIGHAQFNVPGTDISTTDTAQDENQHSWSEEFQLSGNNFGDRLTWVAGVYYMQYRAPQYRQGGSTLNPNNLQTGLTNFWAAFDNRSLAGYGQGTLKLTSKLSLTAGVRYTSDYRGIVWMNQTYPDVLWQGLGIPFVPRCEMTDAKGVLLSLANCSVSAHTTFSEPTWDIDLDYKLNPNTMLYVSQKRGYRSGGYNFRSLSVFQRTPFAPETVMDYEGGVKSDFAVGDWRFRVDADYFWADYANLQRTVSIIIPPNILTNSTYNAAAGHVTGAEVQLIVKPTQQLTLQIDYANMQAGYKSFVNIVNGVSINFSNRGFAGVPRQQATFDVAYDQPLPNDWGDIVANVNAAYMDYTILDDNYQSNYQIAQLYTLPNPTPAQAAKTAAQIAALPPGDRPYRSRPYWMTNLRIDWRNFLGKPLDLSFYMNNVFNVYAEVFPNPSYASIGYAVFGFAPPRMFGFEATYHFR